MKSILTKDCDIDITNGKLSYIKDDKRLAQNVKHRLSINNSEWFLNIALGLDYSKIQGKNITSAEVSQAMQECLTQDSEIDTTELISLTVDTDRHAVARFTYTPKQGLPQYMEEVLELD